MHNYADRLVSSSNALYNTAIYDAHGNMTKIGTGTTPFRLYYDSSDRNSGMDQYDLSGNGVAQYYDRDVQGRIAARYKNTISNWDWLDAGGQYYFHTGSGDTPDYVRNDNWDITEKYLQLPGGVLLTIRPPQTGNAQKTYSLPNIHGDTLATTDASGALTAATTTGPFGEPISSQPKPTNTSPAATYGYVGQHQKLTETGFVLTATQMGARVYLPELGRFAQVDPIEGGTENNYVYPTDPVNEFDLTGMAKNKGRQPRTTNSTNGLSQAEQRALMQRSLGLPGFDKKAAKSAENKLRRSGKYAGFINEAKRKGVYGHVEVKAKSGGAMNAKNFKAFIKEAGKKGGEIEMLWFYIIFPEDIFKPKYGPVA